ncbi:MAG: hypothetical protein CR991_02945 [Proteobacteria bacterium]|nr:MAG: hypothetical protein CR991_02945 [Pseudomonadota bacterium]
MILTDETQAALRAGQQDGANRFVATKEADVQVGFRIRQRLGDPVKGTQLSANDFSKSATEAVQKPYGVQ